MRSIPPRVDALAVSWIKDEKLWLHTHQAEAVKADKQVMRALVLCSACARLLLRQQQFHAAALGTGRYRPGRPGHL